MSGASRTPCLRLQAQQTDAAGRICAAISGRSLEQSRDLLQVSVFEMVPVIGAPQIECDDYMCKLPVDLLLNVHEGTAT